MGLDMYLSAERPVANLPSLVKAKLADALYDTDDLNPEDRELYISGCDHSDADEKEAFHSAVLAAGLEEFVTPQSPSAYIIPVFLDIEVGTEERAIAPSIGV